MPSAKPAIPSARPARGRRGGRVYKPTIRLPGGKTRVLDQSGHYKEQGKTYPSRGEAVEHAAHAIVRFRAEVVQRANRTPRSAHSETGARYLQGEYEMWGGEGSVFDQGCV